MSPTRRAFIFRVKYTNLLDPEREGTAILETPGTTLPATECNIPEDLTFQSGLNATLRISTPPQRQVKHGHVE